MSESDFHWAVQLFVDTNLKSNWKVDEYITAYLEDNARRTWKVYAYLDSERSLHAMGHLLHDDKHYVGCYTVPV